MKFLLSLAWKNLSRYKKRTIITAVALGVGISLFIFMDSMLIGVETESERNLILYETGSARIMDAGYWEKRDQLPVTYVVENPAAVETRLREMNLPAAPRSVFGGELIVDKDPFPEDGSMQVRVFAIDPAKDDAVFGFRQTVVEGRYLQKGENGILLGGWLAEDLGAKVGYPVRIVTRTRYGQHQLMDLTVVGIVNCPNPLINRGAVFMPLDTADYYLEMEGAVTEITVRFPDKLAARDGGEKEAVDRATDIREKLSRDFTGLDVLPWSVLGRDALAIARAKQSGSSVMLLLIFIIAAVGVSNTMLMAIFERTRELGMMRALGMKDSQIRMAFLLEAGGIGFIGSAVGVVFGFILTFWIVRWGIDFSWMLRDMDVGYRISGLMHGAWNPGTMVKAFFIGIIMAAVIAFFPTRRALKMPITDCLRDT